MAVASPDRLSKSVRRTLDDYSAGTRRLFLWSEVVGVIGVGAAIAVDLLNLWPKWAFLPNLFNSIVGFLIGVPVALVLLTTLANEREDNQLERLSCAAWDDFAERVKTFCSDSRIEALEEAELELGELWRSIRHQLIDAIGSERTKAIVNLPRDAAYTEFQARMKTWCQDMTTKCVDIEKRVSKAETLELDWLALRRSWTVLDVTVKTQRYLADKRGWLPDSVDVGLRQKLERTGNPLSEFSNKQDKKALYSNNPPMGDVPHWLCKCSRMTRQNFAQELANTDATAPYTLNADTYIAAAVHARMFLEELKGHVEAAKNLDKWPGTCSQTAKKR